MENKLTMAELRNELFGILKDLKAGKITPQQAQAGAKVAQAILKAVEVQVTYEKLRLAKELPADDLAEMILSSPMIEDASGRAKKKAA